MTEHIAVNRQPRGKGPRSRAAKVRKQSLAPAAKPRKIRLTAEPYADEGQP